MFSYFFHLFFFFLLIICDRFLLDLTVYAIPLIILLDKGMLQPMKEGVDYLSYVSSCSSFVANCSLTFKICSKQQSKMN